MNPAPLLIAVLFVVCHSFAVADEKANPSSWIASSTQWAELRAGEVILLKSDTSGEIPGYSATAAILIDAPPSEVWDVVDDGNKAAGFQESLVSSKILERNSEYTLVEQVVKIGFHKVKYVVRQIPSPPSLINFSLENGDLKEMDGFWRFLPVGEKGDPQTLAIYRLSIEPTIPIPAFMIRNSIAKNLPDTLRSVRDETIRRR